MGQGELDQDSHARERKLLQKYPFHIYLLVKVAKEAVTKGRARTKGGMLCVEEQHRDEPNKMTDTSDYESLRGPI